VISGFKDNNKNLTFLICIYLAEDETDGQTGCLACLSKVVRKKNSVFSDSEVLDETDDWEFLSMYWWSRYFAMEGIFETIPIDKIHTLHAHKKA
jgi:hypothetical protein